MLGTILTAAFLSACAPTHRLPSAGASLTPLPKDVWTTGRVPCPYREVGPVTVQDWLYADYYRKFTLLDALVYVPREVDQIGRDTDFSSSFRDRGLWNVVNDRLASQITGVIKAADADALIDTHIAVLDIQVTREECESLDQYKCDPSHHKTMPLIIVSGVAVEWLCPTGQPKP